MAGPTAFQAGSSASWQAIAAQHHLWGPPRRRAQAPTGHAPFPAGEPLRYES